TKTDFFRSLQTGGRRIVSHVGGVVRAGRRERRPEFRSGNSNPGEQEKKAQDPHSPFLLRGDSGRNRPSSRRRKKDMLHTAVDAAVAVASGNVLPPSTDFNSATASMSLPRSHCFRVRPVAAGPGRALKSCHPGRPGVDRLAARTVTKCWCRGSIGCGTRGIRPVSFGVVASDDYTLAVPAQAGSHISRTIAQGEAATTAIRLVGLGAVEEQVAVQRYLACFELDIYRLAELLRVEYSLVEYVGVVIFAEVIRQVAETVGARYVAQAGVLDSGVVDCEPGGHGLRWC